MTANMLLRGEDSEASTGISLWTGVTAEVVVQLVLASLVSLGSAGESQLREQDLRRPRVFMVKAGRRLVE